MEFAKKHVQHEIAPDAEGVRHFDGVDISWCLHDLALLQFGPEARERLAAWGITSTDDFGAIVFMLVGAGLIRALERDRPEEFHWVFKFADEFQWGPHWAVENAEDDSIATQQSPSEPLRTPPSFGLKALLLAVTLACLGAGWFGWRWRFAQFQEQLVGEIRATGGDIYYEGANSKPFGRDFHANVFAIILADMELTPELAGRIARLRRLRHLQLDECRIEPGAMEQLAKLPQLTYLGIYGGNILDEHAFAEFRSAPIKSLRIERTQLHGEQIRQIGRIAGLEDATAPLVSDSQLAHLGSLKQLRLLSLHGASIRGPGLRHLADLAMLESLDLSHTPIDDDALAHLPALPGLITLDLSNTGITDTALGLLRRFPRLQEVHVDKTAVTQAAAEKLGTLRVINYGWLDKAYVPQRISSTSSPAKQSSSDPSAPP
jgi:uncharacterized repeat protein (TIGR04138 family)